MEHRIPDIYRLIPLVIAEIGAVEKGQANKQQGFKYRGIDQIINAIQPAMAKHGLFVTPNVQKIEREERTTKSGSNLIYTVLTIIYFCHAPDGSAIQATVIGEAMDSGDKSANKAMSQALKYFLCQTFLIRTEDADADAETHETAPKTNNPVNSSEPPQDVPF